MSIIEWIISLALIALVVRQMRGRKITLISLLWPVALVLYGAFTYLRQVPQYRSDWTFVIVVCCIGLALGGGCGFLTDVYRDDGVIKARARILAAVLWIIGMGSRLVFGLVATNGGAEKIGEWSLKMNLHSAATWPTALITMALVEVLTRSGILFVRYRQIARVDHVPLSARVSKA